MGQVRLVSQSRGVMLVGTWAWVGGAGKIGKSVTRGDVGRHMGMGGRGRRRGNLYTVM